MQRSLLADPALPEAWQSWVGALCAVLSEGLLPLVLLHCRRGQPRVPLASLAASLDAAGGKPVPGAAAVGVARLLSEICPDVVSLERLGSGQLHLSFKLSPKAVRSDSEHQVEGHRPAQCAGVVAKGFSLALPNSAAAQESGLKDPQGKRWRKAQSEFYTNIACVERELNVHKASVCRAICAWAEMHREEEPPSFAFEQQDGQPAQSSSSSAQANTDADVEAPPALAANGCRSSSEAVLSFIADLQQEQEYKGQVCHVESYPARSAEYGNLEELVDSKGARLLSDDVTSALRNQLGIGRLFRHQLQSLQAVLAEKKHLCLTTGTSSGKSLAFALPILEEFRKNPNTTALILFPTKALAQDQLGKLQKLFRAVCPGLNVCTFDGDTARADRPELMKNFQVFLTNPDMLHYTILAYHSRWRHILEKLRFIVLDEAHVYRAVFGTHIALLLRRLRRVLQHYNARPQFIACSATMRNAKQFFSQLLALEETEDAVVIDDDAAGRGERRFCIWNPPDLENDDVARGVPTRQERNSQKRGRFLEREGKSSGLPTHLPPGVAFRTRASPFEQAAWILAQAMRRGHRTVCFLQVRSMVEVVLQAATGFLDDDSGLKKRVAAYRAGYSAEERRRLEQQLHSGDLLGVVATNALELGIDIGDLDVTIHVGVPPTVASIWQQAGRAGRRGRASSAVLVAMDAPLEQHFCRYPEEFFARTLEARVPDVDNEFLLRGHLLCAASELAPLRSGELPRWFGENVSKVVEECRQEGKLVLQLPRVGAPDDGQGSIFRYCHVKGRKTPKEEVNLRDIDPVQFQIIVRGSTTPLETLDQKSTFMRLHPGALYLHQQWAYFVEELDLTKHIAWVIPKNPKQLDYYTESREHAQVVLAGGGLARAAALRPELLQHLGTPVVRSGPVKVHWRMYGFRKKAKKDHRILDMIDLALPPVEFPTQAVWMDLPGAILQPLVAAGHSVDRGGLHALEHAMIAMAPLCCDLEAAELSCQHVRRDGDPNRYLLLLYEQQKGGAGTAARVYTKWEELLERAVRLIEECPCESGCPKCIIVPRCGEYNHGLDKVAALKIGFAFGFCRRWVPQSDACPELVASQQSVDVLAAEPAQDVAPAAASAEPPQVEQQQRQRKTWSSSTFAKPLDGVRTTAQKRLCFELD